MLYTCCLSVNIEFMPNDSSLKYQIEVARMANTSFAQWKVAHAV